MATYVTSTLYTAFWDVRYSGDMAEIWRRYRATYVTSTRYTFAWDVRSNPSPSPNP